MRLPSAGPDVVFRVASFNFGIDQKMLGGTGQHQLNKPKESTTKRNIAKFAFLCDHIVQHGDAHILFGCEVGGKEEGFRAVGVSMSDLLRQPFGDGVIVQNHFNYMSVCGFCSDDVRAKVIENTCMVHSCRRGSSAVAVVLLSLPFLLLP